MPHISSFSTRTHPRSQDKPTQGEQSENSLRRVNSSEGKYCLIPFQHFSRGNDETTVHIKLPPFHFFVPHVLWYFVWLSQGNDDTATHFEEGSSEVARAFPEFRRGRWHSDVQQHQRNASFLRHKCWPCQGACAAVVCTCVWWKVGS